MTKSEFVERVAPHFESKKAAADAVETVLGAITETLARGGDVNFTGFGKFSVAERGRGPAWCRGASPGIKPQSCRAIAGAFPPPDRRPMRSSAAASS